jgi:hypothetical protein
MAGLLLLGSFILNQVMIVHLPAYSQGSLHQDVTDVMIKFKDDVHASVSECSDVFAHFLLAVFLDRRGQAGLAIPSYTSSWRICRSSVRLDVSRGRPLIFRRRHTLLFGLYLSDGWRASQKRGRHKAFYARSALIETTQLPNGMQAQLSGSADRLYVNEQFHRYGCCSIKLWWLGLVSIGALLSLVFDMMIFSSTTSYLASVNVIGKASQSSLGLSSVFIIIAAVLMFVSCCLAAYEQVWKVKLKDLEFAFQPTTSIGAMSAYDQPPPSYGSPSAQAQSAFLPTQSYFPMGPPPTPVQFDSPKSTPRRTDFKRPYPSPRAPKSEYSEDSYATTVVTPKKKQEAFKTWGAPLQR